MVRGDLTPESAYDYQSDEKVVVARKVLGAQRLKRLDMTFCMPWMGPDAPASRNVYEIVTAGEQVKLTILHFDLTPEQEGLKEAWAQIASSLKSLLETGKGLVFEVHT